jgi:hypothetical protein
MPLLIWRYKYWIAIAVLSLLWLGQIAYTNHLSGKLKEAESKCQAKIQEIERKQIEALAKKQDEINQVSADYEQAKSEQRGQVETVTREVQKIIERPVYQQHYFDDFGLQQLNSLIAKSPD